MSFQLSLLAKYPSDRVKSVHFQNEFFVNCLYNGHVNIYQYENNKLILSEKMSDLPLRAVHWLKMSGKETYSLVCGGDDLSLHLLNIHTKTKKTIKNVHSDYIRSIIANNEHIISCSDDLTVSFTSLTTFEKICHINAHQHYVMMVHFINSEIFMSCSLDKQIKVWNIKLALKNNNTPLFTLEGHNKGVNCISAPTDKPFILSGSDDHLIKLWDTSTKHCLASMSGHTNNVSFAHFHPKLPLIISGSEDGTIKVWHSNTHKLLNSYNFGMERIWCCDVLENHLVVGCDDGTLVLQLGNLVPLTSFNDAKLLFNVHFDINHYNLSDLEIINKSQPFPIHVSPKELGTCDVYPAYIQHSPNGRFCAIVGESQYIIYTALAWRNKAFGPADLFAWSSNNECAIFSANDGVQFLDKQFKSKNLTPQPPIHQINNLFSGPILGIQSKYHLCFYDFENACIIRKIECVARNVIWNQNNNLCCIITSDSIFLLQYNHNNYLQQLESNSLPEDGVETAFTMIHQSSESITSALFINDVLILHNKLNKCNALIYSTLIPITIVTGFLVGYYHDSLLFNNATNNTSNLASSSITGVYFPQLYLDVLLHCKSQPPTEQMIEALNNLDNNYVNKLAIYLESIDQHALALVLTTDPAHKFDLAVHCKKLQIALDMILVDPSQEKYRVLAQVALADWEFEIAEECLLKGNDLDHLLLLYSSSHNKQGLKQLGELGEQQNKFQIAFHCAFLIHDYEKCVQLLITSGMMGEACLFSKQYIPERVLDVLQQYKQQLQLEADGKGSSGVSPASAAALMKRLQEDVPFIVNNATQAMEIDDMMRLKQHNTGTNSESMEVNTTGTLSVKEEEMSPEKKRYSPYSPKQQREYREPPTVPVEKLVTPERPVVVEKAPTPQKSPEIAKTLEPQKTPEPVQNVIKSMEDELEDLLKF